jgi:hypothetical protein
MNYGPIRISNDLLSFMCMSVMVCRVLRENEGLTRLRIWDHRFNEKYWSEFCEAISTHASFRVLKFRRFHPYFVPAYHDREGTTRAVARMLSVEKQVEDIRFDDEMFDR